ncbi:MAG: DUF5050 domain-containing protein [Chitinophagaceae bacterium]|nr:DUF5050 domain-containing protein [Chitinophagaceae bacterium]
MLTTKRLIPFLLGALFITLGCEKTSYNFDDLPDTVKSYFTTDSAAYDVGDVIQFNNKSESADTYLWDFGDGTSSTDQNPTKSYGAPGIFTVALKAIGPGGTGNYTINLTIRDTTPPPPTVKDMFFIEYGTNAIRKIQLVPGSSAELIADITDKAGVGLVYDSVNEKIYFTDFEFSNNGKVWRMNLDGTGLEELVSDIVDPYSIAINLNAGKIYWADDDGNISRADLDGGNLEREFVKIPDGMMRGIAYDSKNDIIYFQEVNEEVIYVCKGDGTGVSKLLTGTYGYSLFVDEVNDKLYYDDRNTKSIKRANLDGSGAEKFVDANTPSTRIHGMGIDYNEGKFYWADRNAGIIKRANLDGTNIENFLSGLSSPRGLFIK